MTNQDVPFKLSPPKGSDAREVYFQQVPEKPAAGQEGYGIPLPAGQDHVWVGAVNAPYTRLPFNKESPWDYLEAGFWVLGAAIVILAGLIVVRRIWTGAIDLSQVVSEADGKASLARFQALLFTFVFLIAFILIVMKTGKFPPDIPGSVLAVLAGSAGTFLISKYMQPKGEVSLMDIRATRMLWCEQNMSIGNQAVTCTPNLQQASTAYAIIPGKSTATGPGVDTDYTVIGVLAGKAKVTVTPIRSADAKGKIFMRFKSNTIGPVTGQQVFENSASAEITELTAALFGGDLGETAKLEIKV